MAREVSQIPSPAASQPVRQPRGTSQHAWPCPKACWASESGMHLLQIPTPGPATQEGLQHFSQRNQRGGSGKACRRCPPRVDQCVRLASEQTGPCGLLEWVKSMDSHRGQMMQPPPITGWVRATESTLAALPQNQRFWSIS